MPLTQDLGRFASGLTFENLPREAVETARTGFIDRDEPAKKRLLYRLWLEGRPPRPMVPEVQLYQNRSGHMGVDPQPGRGPR